MNKLHGSGSQISYGPDLPPSEQAFDGALHYKTGDNEGLYLFSIVQDSNLFQVGDQTTQRWTAIFIREQNTQLTGGTISDGLTIVSSEWNTGLRFSNDSYTSGGNIGPYGAAGQGLRLGSDGTQPIVLVAGTSVLSIQSGQNLVYTPNYNNGALSGSVWTSANDGAGSGLDADLLDGLHASQFAQLDSNGKVPVATFPFTPVQQGGGTGQLNNKVHIGWSSAGLLRLQIDTSDYGPNWPININGNATTATNAGRASSAASADNATYANTAGNATTAGSAASATNANYAATAGSATNANYANSAGSAGSATNAQNATNATNATNAQNAVRAQTAGFADAAQVNANQNWITGNGYGQQLTLSTANLEQIRDWIMNSLTCANVGAIYNKMNACGYGPGSQNLTVTGV